MLIEEIFGKTITNIFATFGIEDEWLDTADCFIELDYNLVIGFPNGYQNEVWIRELDSNAENILINLTNYNYYHVNKKGRTIREIKQRIKKRDKNILYRLVKAISFGLPILPAYKPYKVDTIKNNARNIINSKIVDFLWYDDEVRKGHFILDNDYVITETTMSPVGTGRAGLNFYESLTKLIESKGDDYYRLRESNKGSR